MRLSLLALLLVACADDGDDWIIAEEPLSGTVAGEPWSFLAGEVDPFFSEGELLYATLWPETYDACELGSHAATSWLVVQIPAELGEHPFTPTQNGTFVYEEQEQPMNLPTFSGLVRVDALDDTELSGGLTMTDGSPDFEVSGTFTLTMCDK